MTIRNTKGALKWSKNTLKKHLHDSRIRNRRKPKIENNHIVHLEIKLLIRLNFV